jgi:hypothetical protein
MKKKHRENLLKLADYLDKLPDDYEQFHMYSYMAQRSSYGWATFDLNEKPKPECGTVACAVGHGPAAGIRIYGDWDWESYADRVFGELPYDDFSYMFGSSWCDTDNTPKGAAARIRTFVELGKAPEGWALDCPKVLV